MRTIITLARWLMYRLNKESSCRLTTNHASNISEPQTSMTCVIWWYWTNHRFWTILKRDSPKNKYSHKSGPLYLSSTRMKLYSNYSMRKFSKTIRTLLWVINLPWVWLGRIFTCSLENHILNYWGPIRNRLSLSLVRAALERQNAPNFVCNCWHLSVIPMSTQLRKRS